MLNRLLYKFFHPRQVVGVVVRLGADPASFEAAWVAIAQIKGKVTVTGKGMVKTVEELKQTIPQGVPLVLSLTGKGVLVRKVVQAKAEKPEVLVQEMLPGAKPQDYYIDTVVASLGQVMAAMVRRSVADELIARLQSAGLDVLGIHIGPLAVVGVIPLLSLSTDEELVLGGYSLKFNPDGLPESVERVAEDGPETMHSVAGEQLTSDHLLPFATALGFWLDSADSHMEAPATGHHYEEYLHKSLFSKGIKAVLGVFFVALLVNFIVFNLQYGKNQALLNQTGDKQERLKEFEELKKEYELNLAFLNSEGWLKPAKASYYADAVAAVVPENIVLTQMVLYPDTAQKKSSSSRSRYHNGSILVGGQVGSSAALQQWATEIRQLPWTETVTVKNYSQENPSQQGTFDLEIAIKQ